MEYWTSFYKELSEKIIGYKDRGEVNDPDELDTIARLQDGDAVRVLSEVDLAGNAYIFRYTEVRDERNEIIKTYWRNMLKTDFAGGLPEIKHVDLWHEQVSYLAEELPFDTPSIFIGFSTIDIKDRGQLVQGIDVQVDMYLFYETFSDTYFGSDNQDRALEYLNSLTRLYALFHGKEGENYSEMRRVDMREVDSGGAGNLYKLSFQCMVNDYSAQHLFIESVNPNAQLIIEKGGAPQKEDTPPLYTLD